MSKLKKEKDLAIQIIKKASEITEWFRKSDSKSYTKKDQTPVTLADYASQIFINSSISEKFPEDLVVAEEDIINLKDSDDITLIEKCYNYLGIDREVIAEPISRSYSEEPMRMWTVDPVDGTRGFQKNLWYSIGIGLIINKMTEFCVICVPNYDDLGNAIYIAQKGKGAQVSHGNTDFKPIHVSKTKKLHEATMCQSLHYNEKWVENLAKNAGVSKILPMDSMVKFCKIADGTADFYVKPLDPKRSFSWDFVPGDLLVREAGGKVSNLTNESLRFEGKSLVNTAEGLIASNGILHDNLIDQIKSVK